MSSEIRSDNQNALANWVDDLACPVCHAALGFDAESVVCSSCGRIYPIVDGIPVLIADRAVGPDR
jgi:uncharacterized protein YbaR (Trm112 family)